MKDTVNTPLAIILSIAKFQAVFCRKLDGQLSVHGLGFNDFIILHYLTQAEGKKLRRIDLAEMIGVTASGITRMLAPMEKIGWIGRESNERDARISYVLLAPGGKRLYKESLQTAQYVAESYFADRKCKNTEMLLKAFQEISDNL